MDISRYKRYIEAALEHDNGGYLYEDVERLVAEGEFQLWPGAHSVIITQIINFPRKRIAHVFLAAGNLAEIERMTPALEAWSKEKGCVGVEMIGRRGWERTFLSRSGYKSQAVLYTKDYATR